jgi:lipopolysaccharide biosynthesis regulator YciM
MAHYWLALCHAELGTFAEGRALGDAGLQIAEAAAHPGSLMFASWGIGQLSLRQGALPRAIPHLERAVGIAQDADFPGYFPQIATTLGAAYALAGRIADAAPLLAQAREWTIAMDSGGYPALFSFFSLIIIFSIFAGHIIF